MGFQLRLDDAGWAQMPQGEYLDGKDSKVGVVLAHGRGNSPDGNVVGPLRRAIHKDLGFHTFSLRMPDPGADSPDSPELAARFLRFISEFNLQLNI
jgi:hypothetical protein